MNNRDSIAEEINNKRDAIFQCLRCGAETKLPESIYHSGGLSLVKGSSMYPQSDILYPQLFGTKNHGCIHNHSFCAHNKAHYKEKIRSPIRYIKYKIKKEIKKDYYMAVCVHATSTPQCVFGVVL